MLRRDPSARIEKSGPWIFARYRFTCAALRSMQTWNAAQTKALLIRQEDAPVTLLADADLGRTWWMYQDEIYWEDEGYSEVEVKALIFERRARSDRRVRRAIALMEQSEVLEGPARTPIADEVKAFVWNRDGGRCVKCASNQRLEFDHVIPLALGGANTARNLQLLCEACNRSKGAALA